MDPLQLVIPSHRRLHLASLKMVPEHLYEHLHLALYDEEVDAYSAKYPFKVIKCGPIGGGIAKKRRIINEHFAGRRVWVVDDDLRFGEVSSAMRPIGGRRFAIHKNPEIIFEKAYVAIDLMTEDGIAIGGCAQCSFGVGRKDWPVILFANQYTNMFFDLRNPDMQGFDWEFTKVWSDLHANYQAVERGYVPYSLTFVCSLSHTSSSAAGSGGCFEWRTNDLEAQAFSALSGKYPQFKSWQRRNIRKVFTDNGGNLEAAYAKKDQIVQDIILPLTTDEIPPGWEEKKAIREALYQDVLDGKA